MTHSFSPMALFGSLLGLAAFTALFAWTSRINQFFFFARTLPAGFAATAAGKAITRRYIGLILIGGGLGILASTVLYAYIGRSIVAAVAGGLVIEIVAFHLAFAYAHHAAGAAYPAYAGSLTTGDAREEGEPRTITVPLLADPATRNLQMLLAPLLLGSSFFLAGFATGNGTLAAFTGSVFAGGGALLLGTACGMLFGGTAQQLLLRYSARMRTPMAQYLVKLMATLCWIAAFLIGALVLAARLHYPITMFAANRFLALLFVLVVAHLIYLWSRNNRFTPSAAEQNGDQYWHAGLFYYNRQDPALFVQRRSGPGFTLNFANRYSWLIAAIVIADPIFVLVNRHHL